MSALPFGILSGISEQVYHEPRLGVASKSALDQVERSPAHYRAWLDGTRSETSAALEFGRAMHCAILEPERFAEQYVVEPDFGDCRKTANKAARDAWRLEHAGAVTIEDEQMTSIRGIVSSLKSHELASKLLAGGESEVTLSWEDQATRLPCKGRVDYFIRDLGIAVDVKSTEDASPEAFRRSIARYGYHRQDAFYRGGFRALGVPLKHFAFVVVEKSAPFATAVYMLDAEAVASGEQSVARNMITLAGCVRRDEWPGYPTEIQTLSLPPWAA